MYAIVDQTALEKSRNEAFLSLFGFIPTYIKNNWAGRLLVG
jgi:hypothetical protein